MEASRSGLDDTATRPWRRFVATYLTFSLGGVLLVYAFVLVMDPYGINPLLPGIPRPLVSISQRYMYPQLIRSGRFDSFVVGTSTSRLLDPKILDAAFHAKFANLGMDSMTAWEQTKVIDYFVRKVGEPKVLLIGLDGVWCDPDAERNRITFRGFPDWLYDDNPLRAFLYLLNNGTVEIAGRLVGFHLGLYPERVRDDGFEVFVPPDSSYDLARARQNIGRRPAAGERPDDARPAASFPALQWLDDALARMPGSLKILAYMPIHVAAQPAPGTARDRDETACKRRIAAIAGERHAVVVDWRIPSPLTEDDANYWDGLHYRLPVAERVARDTADAVLNGAPAPDGAYRIVVR